MADQQVVRKNRKFEQDKVQKYIPELVAELLALHQQRRRELVERGNSFITREVLLAGYDAQIKSAEARIGRLVYCALSYGVDELHFDLPAEAVNPDYREVQDGD